MRNRHLLLRRNEHRAGTNFRAGRPEPSCFCFGPGSNTSGPPELLSRICGIAPMPGGCLPPAEIRLIPLPAGVHRRNNVPAGPHSPRKGVVTWHIRNTNHASRRVSSVLRNVSTAPARVWTRATSRRWRSASGSTGTVPPSALRRQPSCLVAHSSPPNSADSVRKSATPAAANAAHTRRTTASGAPTHVNAVQRNAGSGKPGNL
jgi:hypothetical protein